MARFKYLGEPARTGLVTSYGTTVQINVPKKDGTTHTLTPISPATEFVINVDIGYEITDEFSLRALRADTARFQELP